MSVDILLILLVSVLLSALLYQPVVFIFRELKIVDTPDWRKYDFKAIPLGGGFLMMLVCIIGMVLGLMLFNRSISSDLLIILLGALALFITGIVDDVYQLRASIKLLVQLFVSFATLLTSSILLDDFHGLFGLGEIAPSSAWLLTMIFLVVFMNMINLIDGIDGLASGIGITALVFILSASEMANDLVFSIFICLILGALVVLFVRNHMKGKMYLGDSGSLSLGYILGCLTLHMLTISEVSFPVIDYTTYGPVYAMSLFWYPLMDLGRVFILRLVQKRSPFSPDNNHFHHRMVNRGYSHLSVSLTVMGFTLMFELLSFYLSKFMGVNALFLVMFGITSLTAYAVFLRPNKTAND
jgi:UDP-GlcNAc:undecaprenyl-phosphate GlcNAc-1-phosphate transferase